MKVINNIIYNKFTSLILIFIYIISPVIIMFYNYFSNSNSLDFWYKLTIIIGVVSLIIGGLNFLFNNKKKTLSRSKVLIYFLIALVGATVATICSNNFSLSFFGGDYKKSGLLSYILYLGFFLNAFNIRKKDIKKIFILLVIIALGMSVIALQNNEFTYKVFFMNKDPYNGIFYHFNHMGYYLSIVIILNIFLFMYEKSFFGNFLFFASYYILVMTLIINNTFGSYLAVLFTIILLTIYFFYSKRWKILFLLFTFLLCSCFIEDKYGNIVYNNFSSLLGDANTILNSDNENELKWVGTNRGVLWSTALFYIKESPFVGYGPENAKYLYEKSNINEASPHNFLLEIAIYNGIPTLLFYLLGVGVIILSALLVIKELSWGYVACMFACISYLISGMFGNIFFYTSPYYCIILGILYHGIFKKDVSIYKKIGKRFFDVILSSLLLIILFPIMLIVSLLVKIDSPGNIIYKHERIGLDGKKFYVYKFRTMYNNWEENMKLTEKEKKKFLVKFKLKDDKRMTRVGKILRKTSIDELPQLLNVLKGDMSLIGPRPIVLEELERYKDNKELFLSVRPGISGNWACNGRNNVSYKKRMKYELDYVKNYSLLFDIKLFFKTIYCVIFQRGVS